MPPIPDCRKGPGNERRTRRAVALCTLRSWLQVLVLPVLLGLSPACGFAADAVNTATVTPPSNIANTGILNPWTLTSATCRETVSGDAVSSSLSSSTLTIPGSVLQEGKDVTCVYTNTKKAGLQIVKVVRNDNDGTATVGAFGLATSATPTLTFDSGVTNGDDTTYTSQDITVVAGTYSITEIGAANYDAGSWSCSGTGVTVKGTDADAGQITLADGADAVCSITNDDTNAADLSITKTNATTEVQLGGQTFYTIVVNNKGPAVVRNAVIRDTPDSAHLGQCIVVNNSIATTGTVTPPAVLNMSGLMGTGVTIPFMGVNSTLSFQVRCNVQ